MPNPLDNLCGPGKPLKAEPLDAGEIAGLLRTGVARLPDCRHPNGGRRAAQALKLRQQRILNCHVHTNRIKRHLLNRYGHSQL